MCTFAKLVECSDYDTEYGILEVKDVDIDEVQNKIYEIKNKFYDEGIEDWCIEEVLEEFPEDWDWTLERIPDQYIEI